MFQRDFTCKISALVKVTQTNVTKRVDICRRRFLTGIGTCGYRGQKVPNPAIRDLKNHANQCVALFESESLKTRNTNVQGQKKTDVSIEAGRANLPFLCLFVLFSSSMDWMIPAQTVRMDVLYSVYSFKC
jgi:hypothetical protein